MAFSPLGAVSDVTIFVKLLIPDVNPQVNWLRCRQHEIISDLPLIAAQTKANSWAEFRCMRTFLVLQGIIYTQLQTCEWVAAEHRSHPLVSGNSWARILSFTHVEALHAEAVGPGNWNVLKRNGSQGIFCSRLFLTKGCPDRSCSHGTADQHPLDTGLSISTSREIEMTRDVNWDNSPTAETPAVQRLMWRSWNDC